ncbi:hypothetical protein [uncultured Thermomonospora sp.]|uniref:hypothetical protein n=1 Tax=uncultured Thermomonospora sp. TaxID=671175 RepID=UPI00259BCACA|nr:hypothetical protein [uncultured Thermomonospora sp.]
MTAPHFTFTDRNGGQLRYEAGEADFLLRHPSRFHADRIDLTGPSDRPRLLIAGSTTRTDHQFCVHAEFTYRPSKGFVLESAQVSLARPASGSVTVRRIFHLTGLLADTEEDVARRLR